MASVANIYASVQADMKGFEKDLTDGAKKAGDKAGDEAGKSFSSRFKDVFSRANLGDSIKKGFGIGLGFAGVQGLGSIVSTTMDTIGESIQLASDKAESASKANVIFGESYKGIEEASKTATEAVALSSGEYLAAAGNLGNLFVNMKLTEERSAEMSVSMIQLASDMGSFGNAAPVEVLEAMQSALVGETEPLRRFGVSLSAAKIQQEALNLGLVKGKEALTDAAKAEATYSLILKSTTNAQGDRARTADSLANRQVEAAAKMKQAMEDLGEALQPLALEIMPVIADVGRAAVEGLKGLVGVAKDVARVITDIQRVIGVDLMGIVPALTAALAGIVALNFGAKLAGALLPGTDIIKKAMVDRFLPAILSTVGPTGPLSWAALLGAGAYIAIPILTAGEPGSAKATGEWIQAETDRILAEIRAKNEQGGEDAAEGFAEGLSRGAQTIYGSMQDIYLRNHDMWEGVKKTTAEGTDTMLQLQRRLAVASASQWTEMRDKQVAAIKDAMIRSINAIEIGVVDMRDKIKNGKQAVIDQMRDLQWQLKHPFAEENYEKWLEKKHRRMMQLSRQAIKDGRPEVAAQARAAAADIMAELNSLPTRAYEIAQRVAVALAAIRETAVRTGTVLMGSTAGVAGRAVGGPASGMTWVGESGPELVSLPRGSHVNTARTSQAMARDSAESGGGSVHVYLHTPDGQRTDIGAAVMRAIQGASESAHIRYMNPSGA